MHVASSTMISLKVLLGLVLCLRTALAYDQTACCELAKSKRAFVAPVPPLDNQTCGQTYSPGLPAAQPLWVPYNFCGSQCPGIQLSKFGTPSEWAAPLVSFILPSVIFSMSVPRRKKIEFNYQFEFEWPRRATRWQRVNDNLQLLCSLICFIVLLIPVTVDTVIWISVIIVGAGNMLVGGLYESHLDYRIMKYVKGMAHGTDEDNLRIKRELLVTVASGNLRLDKGNPQKSIPNSITIPGPHAPKDGYEKARSRLLNLLGAQVSFGEQVGSPVLFYLGAFVYTILDLRTSLSDEDSAISVSFGIQWMIIVHVAIIGGCLLATNNPNTPAGIVGSGHEALDRGPQILRRRATLTNHALTECTRWTRERFNRLMLGWSDTYETEFQPVSLWDRGSNKMRWIRESEAWKDPEFRRTMNITWPEWLFNIFLPALALSVLPPAAGGVSAYWTPPPGLGCRSLSLLIYAVCQAITTAIAIIRCAIQEDERYPFLQKLFTGWRFKVLSTIFWFGALISGIGGTTMQIMGVFRNCFCKTTAYYWLHDVNKTNPSLDLATDTEAARISSHSWITMGTSATLFMAVTCYVGWWYQTLIKARFIEAVEGMYIPGSFLDTLGRGDIDSTMNPLIHEDKSPMLPEDGVPRFEPRQSGLGRQRHAYIRESSPESLGRRTSTKGPSITISYDQ